MTITTTMPARTANNAAAASISRIVGRIVTKDTLPRQAARVVDQTRGQTLEAEAIASTAGRPTMIRAVTMPARINARIRGAAASKRVIEGVTGRPSEV